MNQKFQLVSGIHGPWIADPVLFSG